VTYIRSTIFGVVSNRGKVPKLQPDREAGVSLRSVNFCLLVLRWRGIVDMFALVFPSKNLGG
jgi:hypothetical protein